MTKENWEEFTNTVNTNMTKHHIPFTTNTEESLEKTWHKINTCIITAAFKQIPNRKYAVKNLFHTFTPKATLLHKDLKTIGHIIHRVKKFFSHNIPKPDNIQSLIDYLNTTHNLSINTPPQQQADLPTWVSETKSAWKALYNARNLENNQHLRKHINSAIEKRCERLLTQPTKMINSILNRHNDPVHFHNIKTDTDIISDPNEIKQHISDHFNKWTAQHPYDEAIYNQYWQEEYTPISSINPN
jgi:hypothetical protein